SDTLPSGCHRGRVWGGLRPLPERATGCLFYVPAGTTYEDRAKPVLRLVRPVAASRGSGPPPGLRGALHPALALRTRGRVARKGSPPPLRRADDRGPLAG